MRISGNTGKGALPTDRFLLCYITDRSRLAASPLLSKIRLWIARGIDIIQIREKDLPDKSLYELTRKAVTLARESACRILVNGRADIAVAAGADGVHLPSEGLRPNDLRMWLPPGFLTGVSTHSLREARRAVGAGASYILIGPVFATPSKLKYGLPLGPGLVKEVSRKVHVPVLALGGIHPSSLELLRHTGIAGIAGISLFQNDLDPTTKEAERFVTDLKKT